MKSSSTVILALVVLIEVWPIYTKSRYFGLHILSRSMVNLHKAHAMKGHYFGLCILSRTMATFQEAHAMIGRYFGLCILRRSVAI